MNLSREIRELEKKGVFIEYSMDHYKNGSNCNFSILFRNRKYIKDPKKCYQTGWYGDNHEYGDTARVMECSVRMAKKLLYDDKLEYFFQDGIDWLESKEYKIEFGKFQQALYEGANEAW